MNAWLTVAVASGLAFCARGQSCQCLYNAGTLPSSEVDGTGYESLANVDVYGTTCAAWERVPDTPYVSYCDPSTSDFSAGENWCNLPWCYVNSTCATSIASSEFGPHYSYVTCGAIDCLSDSSAPGCPWDPHGDGSYTQHNDSDSCACLYHGDVLPTAVYSGTSYASGYDNIQIYGTTCAPWDSVPGTPWASYCPDGADFCHQDYNWCAIPWCYVSSSCPTKVATSVFAGTTLYYSYDTCGALDCYTNSVNEADWPNLPAACPYDEDYALSDGCTAWTGVPATTTASTATPASASMPATTTASTATTASTNGGDSDASMAVRMRRLHAPLAFFASFLLVLSCSKM